MRIVIDCRCFYNIKIGIGYYTYNLIDNLSKIDTSNEYTCFYCAWKMAEAAFNIKNCTRKTEDLYFRLLYEKQGN